MPKNLHAPDIRYGGWAAVEISDRQNSAKRKERERKIKRSPCSHLFSTNGDQNGRLRRRRYIAEPRVRIKGKKVYDENDCFWKYFLLIFFLEGS